MSKPITQSAPAKAPVILYGISDGKARAAVFKGPDIEAAVKAAEIVKLAVLHSDSDDARKLARELPIGRIGAKGVNIAPFVRKDLFERLTTLAKQAGAASGSDGAPGGAKADAPEQPKSKSGGPRLPVDWGDLKVGDLVLSQDKDPKQGWWQTIVAEIAGDVIKLRWPDEPRGRPVLKPRLALGLMFAGDLSKPLPSAAAKPGNGTASAYPQNWGSIGTGHIVLAKEDGPMQQWWEAKVIAQEGEAFTLEWRDHPGLPPIKRPRFGLALIHPNPKAR